jgi:hypothetical protein
LDLSRHLTPVNLANTGGSLLILGTHGGNAIFWVLESDNGYSVYVVESEFDFTQKPETELLWNDLTGDGVVELLVFPQGTENRTIEYPRIYDLGGIVPRQLSFNPTQVFEIGLEHTYQWRAIEAESGVDQIHLNAVIYPPCPVSISQTFSWNGEWVERSSSEFTVQPVSDLLGYCDLVVDQAAGVWGPEAAIPIMETLLPDWPPTPTDANQSFAPDVQDEWRYRLGIYHALLGNNDQASEYFQTIIRSPAISGSRWITPARDFSKDFQNPKSLYQSCVKSDFCDARLALRIWVASLSPEEALNALYYLGQGGVAIRYTAPFDFEGDGVPERYFTFRHRITDRLEFWILVESPDGVQALFVDTVDVNRPTVTRYTTQDGAAIVWLGSQQSFSLERVPGSLTKTVNLHPPSYFYADLTNQIVEDGLMALLSGADPGPPREELVDLAGSDRFACLNSQDCARFYFALGLANELAGDELGAVEAYLKVWRDFSTSPFTTLIRLRLAVKPGYTPPPTPTYTPTLTPTITRTPTITPTPSNTPTSTVTPTPDPNATFTPTPSLTPTTDPNATPTGTITNTPTSGTPAPTDTPTVTPSPTKTPETYP